MPVGRLPVVADEDKPKYGMPVSAHTVVHVRGGSGAFGAYQQVVDPVDKGSGVRLGSCVRALSSAPKAR